MMRYFIVVVIIISLSSCLEKRDKEQNPNVIYVLADDLGFGAIAAFNEHSKIQTPNIDKLASEGIRFTDAHTSSSVCTPTRYGILTGRYNWRSNLKSGVLIGNSDHLIPTNRTTVASLLKQRDNIKSFWKIKF